ncbi:MAG: phenylacetic acid degradation operon negative regulatory protein PaaX [Hyphomicrobiales bacterium]|nr:phenylacetic acid degradation operon negative regulatory protein PaaX [Hyphomicrobiales bacterium]MCP5000113.1 phenylacetic acid degradation operon negative regulatory protein PaaX [Hyphomicrobiales bacterium]
MSDSALQELETLIDDFHSQERIRVWSLVITIFGDAVIPRGGELWLGSLQELMDRLRIEPSALRAAMSRLTADGWLTRLRLGRKSYYRLAEAGEAEFAEAARKIYAPRRREWSGEWTIVVLSGRAGDERETRRRQLRAKGFGALAPTVFVRPDNVENSGESLIGADQFVFHSRLDENSDAAKLIVQTWQLFEVENHYGKLIDTFSALEQSLGSGADLDPLSAMVARCLLIHKFRRMALRDPVFPTELMSASWKGDAARTLVSSIYRMLAASSESWLDSCLNSEGQQIPKPEFGIAERFGN